MHDDLKLGYHRLGRRFEDPAELFALAALVWALAAMMVSIIIALDFSGWATLTAVGVAILFLLRGPLADLAARWRRGRARLERGTDAPIPTD